jgi:hypothetical protein
MFRRLQLVTRWHRRVALLVCVWLVALAATGLLINHANDWGLDRSALSAPLQRLFYDIEPAGMEFCAQGADIGPACAAVFGRLSLPAGELVLAPDQLYLIDSAGQLLEAVPVSQLGLNGLTGGRAGPDGIYLRDRDRIVHSDFELMEWQALDEGVEPAAGDGAWLNRSEVGEPITWERLLLDLHAARFLGPLASAFTDFMAILILALALSGTWLWWLKRRRE